MTRPVFSPEATDIIRNILHHQDILLTGLAGCIQDIKVQEYDQFKKQFGVLPFVAGLMAESCDALLRLKKGRRGKKPLWFEWGEDVKYFCLQVERAIPVIKKEIWRNDWDVIACRLEECHRQCLELQESILKHLPDTAPDRQQVLIGQQAAVEWMQFTRTLAGGEIFLSESGFRYRKNR